MRASYLTKICIRPPVYCVAGGGGLGQDTVFNLSEPIVKVTEIINSVLTYVPEHNWSPDNGTVYKNDDQCCGSGMFIPDPDFLPSRISDPTRTKKRR